MGGFYACMSVYQVLIEARRCWVPWDWSYKWLWATLWEPGSCITALTSLQPHHVFSKSSRHHWEEQHWRWVLREDSCHWDSALKGVLALPLFLFCFPASTTACPTLHSALPQAWRNVETKQEPLKHRAKTTFQFYVDSTGHLLTVTKRKRKKTDWHIFQIFNDFVLCFHFVYLHRNSWNDKGADL